MATWACLGGRRCLYLSIIVTVLSFIVLQLSAPYGLGTIYRTWTRPQPILNRITSLLSNSSVGKTPHQNSSSLRSLSFGMSSSIRGSLNHVTKPTPPIRRILLFNPADWFTPSAVKFNFSLCPVGNCMIHVNRTQLIDSDAVWFSISDPRLGTSPPISPARRNPDQVWVVFSRESPHYINVYHREYLQPGWKNVFNWSMTYRKGSDIFAPYGILKTKTKTSYKNYSNIFKEKSKFAAWLVSHCNTQSKREAYVQLLRKYIPVDIYGGCNNLRHSKYSELFGRKYKFYLGFENSLCPEYITEKYFFYSNLDLITVVRGGADYASVLPNKTYISTDDFPSVKKLAEYLLQLNSSESEYISYLKRKDMYEFEEYPLRTAYCGLCEKLNDLHRHRKTIDDVGKWVREGACHNPVDLVTS